MIKNIKINNKLITKKIKYCLIPIALSTTILLSGCTALKNVNYNPTTSSSQTSVEDERLNHGSNIPMISIGNSDYSSISINYTNNNQFEFTNYLNSLNINYDYDSLYFLDESLKEYNKLNLTENHSSKIQNITYNDLKEIICQNNKKYKNDNKSSIYKVLSESELDNLINIIVNTVNNFIKDNKMISLERIKCVLSNLKIFKQESALCNAFVSIDDCLIISPNMLEVAQLLNGNKTDTDVIIHEINHLLQKGCSCDLENNSNLKYNYGFSYSFNNVKINSLNFSWLYESSAEKNMCNYTGHNALVYSTMISYLESLSLTNVLNDNYKVNDTEKLSFYRSLDDLYSYFNVSNEKDKEEILKMMYSIQIMQVQPDDFYNLYCSKFGVEKSDELVDRMNYTLKNSVCQTMTKLFYKNLSKSILNKKVTLGDVFYLISLFENDMNNHILYDSLKLKDYNKSFITTYLDIQKNFFYELSKTSNFSQDEIERMFKDYAAQVKLDNGSVVDNYNLSFLTDSKKNYLNERKNALKDLATSSIINIDKELTNNSQKVYK